MLRKKPVDIWAKGTQRRLLPTSSFSPAFQEQHPEIALGKATGMRNILVHEYGRVDVEEVWRTVRDDLPALVTALESLLPTAPAGE